MRPKPGHDATNLLSLKNHQFFKVEDENYNHYENLSDHIDVYEDQKRNNICKSIQLRKIFSPYQGIGKILLLFKKLDLMFVTCFKLQNLSQICLLLCLNICVFYLILKNHCSKARKYTCFFFFG